MHRPPAASRPAEPLSRTWNGNEGLINTSQTSGCLLRSETIQAAHIAYLEIVRTGNPRCGRCSREDKCGDWKARQRLALLARISVWPPVGGQPVREHFDRDRALQPRIARTVDLPNPPTPTIETMMRHKHSNDVVAEVDISGGSPQTMCQDRTPTTNSVLHLGRDRNATNRAFSAKGGTPSRQSFTAELRLSACIDWSIPVDKPPT